MDNGCWSNIYLKQATLDTVFNLTLGTCLCFLLLLFT